MNDFFLSSRDTSIEFIKNKYNEGEIGEIKIEFSDYDNSNKKIIVGSSATHLFSDTSSNHNIPLVQNAALVNGFFDYTDLLKIYFHDDPQPNLFDLIVLTILGEHIPISSGGNFAFRKKWEDLQENLANCYTRNDRKHKNAKNFLPTFETQLRTSLDEVFTKTNEYLSTYFIDFNIELNYSLQPLVFNYERWKSNWYTTKDLRLIVKKNGQLLTNGYSNFLNEARLSAIAICMYLASLKVTNKNIGIKILYLDDVFIGLDSGNRIPILNILIKEFSEYQKFISTYDRHWFELAKRYFILNNEKLWKTIELYVGTCTDSLGNNVDKPLLIDGESYSEKAIKYLHNNSNPDYPAAANYFRKAIEEIIHTYMIKFELIDGESAQIPEYKLTSLAYQTKRFLERTGNTIDDISLIISLLHILLHPLSHHEIASPIYKSELILIEKAFFRLQEQLKNLKHDSFQCKLERGSKLKFQFLICSSPCHKYEFEIKLRESIVLYKTSTGTETLPTSCILTKMSGIENDNKLSICEPKSEDVRFHYKSFADAIDKLYDYWITQKNLSYTKPLNYLDIINYFEGNSWQPLASLLKWKTS